MLAQDSFWTTYLFDPEGIAGLSSFLFYLDLSMEGRTRKAGREAIRLVGVPVEEWDYDPKPLWWGADEYEVLADAEAACCCAAPPDWEARTSTRWRSRRSASTSASPRTPSPRANPCPGADSRHRRTSENSVRAKFREHLF